MIPSAQVIKQLKKLHTAKGRKEAQFFIAEGIRTVMSFIENGFEPAEIYATDKAVHQTNLPLDYTAISEDDMNRISPSTTPPGILAVFPIPENPAPEKLSSGIVLAEISDPGNMGTLIRSCAAFGFKSVVVIEGCDPFSPKVIQATAGNLPLISLFQWTWQELLTYKKDLTLCALEAKNGKSSDQLDLSNTLLVVGNEAHGISQEQLSKCNSLLTLPIASGVESLNAAVAGSIALFLASNNGIVNKK